jgi:hypothetical protein
VPAVAGLERLADLVGFQIRDRLVEFRNERSRTRPAEIAAIRRGAGILGGRRGDAREVLAVHDALTQLRQLLAHGRIVVELVGLQQNVPNVNLVDDHRGLAAAALVELHDVKAARGAHRRAHLAGLHLRDQIQNELRQLRSLAPAELAAVERRLAVRIGDRELPEVLALGGACRDVVRFLGDVLELLRAWRPAAATAECARR